MSVAVRADAQPRPQVAGRTLVALTARARWVRSDEREAFARRCEPVAAHPGVVLLHTCHRVELYVAPEAFGDGPLPALPAGGVRLDDADAARHLITVAAGLDSAVVGEDQILHQTREALARRSARGPLHPVLGRLFQTALGAGKRAHEVLGGATRSLGDAALDRMEESVGPLAGRRVLFVGAGAMGAVAARAARRRGARVVVASHTDARAAALADRLTGAEAVPLAEVRRVTDVAGVVVALSGPWEPDPGHLAALVDARTPVVDLSSPLSLPLPARVALAAAFTSIDDLAWESGPRLEAARQAEVERLVADAGRDYCRWLVARQAGPSVKAMSDAAEARRQEELAWLFRRLPHLGEAERALVEQMSHRLVGGILHPPRAAVRGDESGELARALGALFHC